MLFIGIDNGVSGSIAILREDGAVKHFSPTPIIRCLNYTKKKQFLNRVDGNKLAEIFIQNVLSRSVCYIERPMINPTRWKASVSAIRALEATLIILESLDIPYYYIDSKEWQKELLPKHDKKEKDIDLKFMACEVAKRMFPKVFRDKKVKDADGLLIAEYARRKHSFNRR
jgi:hypothetical protein